MKTILIVATLDTKGTEVAFARQNIESLGAKAMLLDAGVLGAPAITPGITREEVARAACSSMEEIARIGSEGEALEVMAQGAGAIALKLHREGRIHGVLGIGGSCGTALGSGVMRHLPIGVPKFMISSQAGNPAVVSSAVKTSDICMFHSVSDVAGLNPLTR
ncbi:MAG: Tm-1-like ATP-binding domain-containing protein, partial [Desulfatiglandales bacterium]